MLRDVKESITSSEQKRKIEGNVNIKKPKKVKPAEPERAPAGDGVEVPIGDVDQPVPNVKPLTEGQTTRIQKTLETLQMKHFNLSGVLAKASADEMKEHVVPALLNKATTLAEKVLNKFIPASERMLLDGKVAKADFQAFFDEVKKGLKDAAEYLERLEEQLEYAHVDN